jgi:hypothetical protein
LVRWGFSIVDVVAAAGVDSETGSDSARIRCNSWDLAIVRAKKECRFIGVVIVTIATNA